MKQIDNILSNSSGNVTFFLVKILSINNKMIVNHIFDRKYNTYGPKRYSSIDMNTDNVGVWNKSSSLIKNRKFHENIQSHNANRRMESTKHVKVYANQITIKTTQNKYQYYVLSS